MNTDLGRLSTKPLKNYFGNVTFLKISIHKIFFKILDFLKQVGALQGSSISKNTFLLVAKDKDDDTSKVKEAKKLNVPIMSIDEFNAVYM